MIPTRRWLILLLRHATKWLNIFRPTRIIVSMELNVDYEELLSKPAPFAGTSQLTVRIKSLPVITASIACFSFVLTAILFVLTGKYSQIPGDSGVHIPTFSRIGTYTPGSYVFSGGLHLVAIMSIPVWWGVSVDCRIPAAKKFVDVAFIVGVMFSIFWFLAGSIPPVQEYDGLSAPQDKVHLIVAILSYLAMVLYSAVTTFGLLAWAKGVFLVSTQDLFWFRLKAFCTASMILGGIGMGVAVGIQKKWFPDSADCSVEWCRSASIQAVGEYVIFPAGCFFVYSLKHDLENVKGHISVDRLYL